ncbi:hypothetical protein WCLP8_4000022 [uncultured Gammaproteobacteria bacterium]
MMPAVWSRTWIGRRWPRGHRCWCCSWPCTTWPRSPTGSRRVDVRPMSRLRSCATPPPPPRRCWKPRWASVPPPPPRSRRPVWWWLDRWSACAAILPQGFPDPTRALPWTHQEPRDPWTQLIWDGMLNFPKELGPDDQYSPKLATTGLGGAPARAAGRAWLWPDAEATADSRQRQPGLSQRRLSSAPPWHLQRGLDRHPDPAHDRPRTRLWLVPGRGHGA